MKAARQGAPAARRVPGGRFALLVAAGLLALLPVRRAAGHERIDPADNVFKRIGVDEKLGAPIPKDPEFRDQDGNTVRLGDLLAGKPAILTLNYYTCPMLCPVTLHNLWSGLDEVRGLAPGRDYRVVTVSIDPDDTVEAARARAAEIHGAMTRVPDRRAAWRFLVGRPDAIGALTRAVGFRYVKVGAEFAHPDVSIVLSPDGKVSRYLYGVVQDPKDLKLALVEAAGGKIGESTALNRVLLFCYQYDPAGRKYALYARNIMKAGGALTLALVGLLYVWLSRRRKGTAGQAPGGTG